MKHLFKYTIHNKTMPIDDIFKALRRSGIVIRGVIHWGVSCEGLDLFSIGSNYPKDHFEGIKQNITARQLTLDFDPDAMNDTILSFEYLNQQEPT